MRTSTTGLLACLLFIAALAAGPAQAGSRKAGQGASSAKTMPGSQESAAERARRLKRECRGRPNAGACLGHAS